MTQRPIEILLVEDSPFDVRLMLQVLQEGSVPKRISIVSNGEQAIDFLRRRGPYADAPRPDLVLLDLNLPRRNGLEVLREIKNDPELRSITVIVLTTSEAPLDVNAAYELNANCYVVKPLDYEQFVTTVRGIEEFWMRLASLPGYTAPSRGTNGDQQQSASASRDQGPAAGPSSRIQRQRWSSRQQRRRTRIIAGRYKLIRPVGLGSCRRARS